MVPRKRVKTLETELAQKKAQLNADGTNIDGPLHMSDKEYAHIMQSFYRNVATHKRYSNQ